MIMNSFSLVSPLLMNVIVCSKLPIPSTKQ